MHASLASLPTRVGRDDRLGLTICLAIVIHALVILGVSFAPEPAPDNRFEALEIVLVPERTERVPEEADLLAQANLVGGGDDDKSDPPAAPIKAPLPAQTADVAAAPAPPLEPQPSPAPAATPAPPAEASPQAPASGHAKVTEVIAVARSEASLAAPEATPQAPPEASAEPAPEAAPEAPQAAVATPPLPTAAQLITRSFALASINAELQQRLDSHARRPRQKYISANTKEYRYAAYMEAWRAKVERIGNLNYPEDARERGLSGSLLLDVALAPDGAVLSITVRRSSGHPLLDDAAVRIVELAAPFAPFPPDIAAEVDVLHVTRTWKFLNNREFSSR
ncbi:MAG: energy transducer TonB [Gammaproteobacteria bacterium]